MYTTQTMDGGMDEDARLQEMVDRLYDPEYGQAHSRKLHICNQDGVGAAGVYGEVISPETIFKELQLGNDDHFVDLGSGRGQIVLAAAMRLAGPKPASSKGVELIDLRHEEAQKAWSKSPMSVHQVCMIKCGDALAEDLSSTTKAFLCNTTFQSDLNEAFAKRFSKENAPRLQRVATMQKLTGSQEEIGQLVLSKVTSVKATYAPNGTPLYVYARLEAVLPDATGGKAAPVMDQHALDAMLKARREADRQAMQQADALSAGAAERGSLRTALMAAALMSQ